MQDLVNKFIEDNKGQEISKHEGSFSLLAWGTVPYVIYAPILSRYFNEDFGTLTFLAGEQKGIGFFNLNNYLKAMKVALHQYLADKSTFTEIDDYHNLEQMVEELYAKNTPDFIKSLDDKELIATIVKSFELLRDWQAITLFCETLDENVVKELFEKFSKGKIVFADFMRHCMAIDFQTYLMLQDEALLRATTDIHGSQWAFSSYLGTPSLKECGELLQQYVDDRGGFDGMESSLDQERQAIAVAAKGSEEFKNLLLSNELIDLFDFTKLSIELRDVRKVCSDKIITVLSNLMREYFIRKTMPIEDFHYALFEDFLTGAHSAKEYPELVQNRKKGFLVYYGRDGVRTEYMDFAKAREALFDAVDSLMEPTTELKGSIGCKGMARGLIKIVLDTTEFSKFQAGDVLVTSMTRPEFVPLIKQASAIITDEGGITCHAAIVSRELNIPCIIGTKNATRVLKDNDLVEVDANKGIISIIHR